MCETSGAEPHGVPIPGWVTKDCDHVIQAEVFAMAMGWPRKWNGVRPALPPGWKIITKRHFFGKEFDYVEIFVQCPCWGDDVT